jgi:deoxyribodipyrimidine photo-lyase
LSAKRIYQEIKAYEAKYGESEQTYWIIFELLWRDYFRFTARKFGSRIFKSQGLKEKHELPPFKPSVFESWINGTTGNAFCDAAMNELRLTGYLSNRMRQNAASYLCHDLKQPWLAGAAWFEHCLIDYDPASNYSNWMYIAGVGNDPRANRYFSLAKQAEMYDPEGSYRAMWK